MESPKQPISPSMAATVQQSTAPSTEATAVAPADVSPATTGVCDDQAEKEEQRRVWREQKRRTRQNMSAKQLQKARANDRDDKLWKSICSRRDGIDTTAQKAKSRESTKRWRNNMSEQRRNEIRLADREKKKSWYWKLKGLKKEWDAEWDEEDRQKEETQKQKKAAEEACWRSKLLPRNDGFELCEPVEYGGKIFSFQCMFCRDLFMVYPKTHMSYCFYLHDSAWNDLPKPPPSLANAFHSETSEYFERYRHDYTSAYKFPLRLSLSQRRGGETPATNPWAVYGYKARETLPTDENCKLCLPVVVRTTLYCYGREDPKSQFLKEIRHPLYTQWKGKSDAVGPAVFHYQCQFCKQLFEDYPLDHLESCEKGNRWKEWGRGCNFCGLPPRRTASAEPPCLSIPHYKDCQYVVSLSNKRLPDANAPRTRVSLERIARGQVTFEEKQMRERLDLGYWLES